MDAARSCRVGKAASVNFCRKRVLAECGQLATRRRTGELLRSFFRILRITASQMGSVSRAPVRSNHTHGCALRSVFFSATTEEGGCVWPKQMTSHDGVIRPKVSSSKRFFSAVAPCKQGELRRQWGGPRVPAPTALCRARHCSVLVSDAKCESPRSIFTCLFCDRHWLRPRV